MDNFKTMRVVDVRVEGGGEVPPSRALLAPANVPLGAGDGSAGGGGAGRVAADDRLTPLRIIWNRRWLVSLCMIVCVAVAGLYAKTRTKLYTRSAAIVLEPTSAKAMGEGMNMESYLNTQAELINSSTAIHASALAILKDKQGKGTVPAALKTFASGGADELAALRENLSATAGRNDEVVTVSFNSPYPDEAAYILGAVVDAYIEFATESKHKGATDDLKTIGADKDKWTKEMHEQHAKLADLEGDIGLLQAQAGVGNVDEQRLQALANELTASTVRAIDAKGEYERVAKSLIPDANQLEALLRTGKYRGLTIAAGHDETQAKSELYTARQHLRDLNERYLPNHPAMQAAQLKVDEQTASYVLLLNRQWVTADARMKDLEENYQRQKLAAMTAVKDVRTRLSTKLAEANDVKEQLAQNKKLTELLSTRLQEVSSLDRMAPVRVHLLSDLDPHGPVDRVRPNVNMILLEGLMVGLVLGLTLSFVDQRLRSVEEVTAASNLPILGVIPHMPRSQSIQARGRRVHLDPMSEVSEAYRGVRTAIYFGPKAKSILITSADRGEGKSTLAANVAIAMTETGHRVLLLDADLRVPMQHRIFAVPSEVGVSSVVAGRAAIERAIQSTGIRGLDLMPCGPVPFNPSETINNQTFADLLAELGARYDYVVVDSPPVMAVTDARILGAMCDLTLMVVRAEKSNKRSVADARDGLLGFGANLLGVVVNDGSRDRRRYAYYGGYGYGRRPGTIVPPQLKALPDRPSEFVVTGAQKQVS